MFQKQNKMFQCQCQCQLVSGSSISLISFDTYERLGKPGSMNAFNNKVLAANNLALKIVGSVDIINQFKPNSGDLAQEFLITADNCLPCFLGLDYMIDQECFLNIGEHLLCSSREKCKNPQLT